MLTELLGSLPLKDIGLGGIVVLVVLMLLTDKLITRKRLEDEQREKEYWRTAASNLQVSFDKISDATSRTVVLAEASNEILTKIQSSGIRVQEARDV